MSYFDLCTAFCLIVAYLLYVEGKFRAIRTELAATMALNDRKDL